LTSRWKFGFGSENREIGARQRQWRCTPWQRETCGKTTVQYDDRCDWTCQCWPAKMNRPCEWTVSCPDGKGGYYDTTGTGHTDTPLHRPSVHVDGELAGIAHILTRLWKRPVTVPEKLAHQRVERRLSGTEEEIARDLGLKLND